MCLSVTAGRQIGAAAVMHLRNCAVFLQRSILSRAIGVSQRKANIVPEPDMMLDYALYQTIGLPWDIQLFTMGEQYLSRAERFNFHVGVMKF